MDKIFESLNEEQIEAVTSTEGYLRIIAGAGSGKTKALVHRYAYLVKAAGIHPSNVLCVTFTNKAAGEMKKRVRGLVGEGYDNSLITTYHGFCVRVLRDDIYRLMYPKGFTILDEVYQRKILTEIYSEMEIKTDKAVFERILGIIHKLKSDEGYVDSMLAGNVDAITIPQPPRGKPISELEATIVRRYVQKQNKMFGLDFDDLISFTFRIFEKFPEVRQKWAERLFYIQVDEFQDSSAREMRLIRMLCEYHNNLFVVGDPDQNIYEWRGADMSILVDFDKNFLGTQTVFLNRNYRSTEKILKVANTVIGLNKNRIEKSLYTTKKGGEEVIHLHAVSEEKEGKWIAGEIQRLVQQEKRQYRDIAIMYRASFLSRFCEQALMAEGIPYELYGSVKFYERMEIKDALAYMTLIDRDDDEAFERIINVPRRQFGKVKMNALKSLAKTDNIPLYAALKKYVSAPVFSGSGAGAFVRNMEELRAQRDTCPVSELFESMLSVMGYENYIRENGSMERLDNLAECKRSLWEREQNYGEFLSLEEYLRQIELENANDEDENLDRVKLMTVHAAKGLEFPVCFVCGMSEGIFPSSRTLEERKEEGLEEERRLCFVALTRAMERLYLTESEGAGNGIAHKKPSRFLFEMGEENYLRIGKLPKDAEPTSEKTAPQPTPQARAVGDSVCHPVFGDGVIKEIDAAKGVYYIFFEKTGALRPVSMDYNFDAGINWNQMKKNAVISAREQKEQAMASQPEPAPQPIELTEAIPQGYELIQEEDDVFDPEDATLPQYEQDDEEVPLWDLPEEVTEDTPEDGEVYQIENEVPLDEPESVTAPKEEITEMPEKYRYAEWAREVTEGENLWKRDDVPHSGWYCVGMIDLGAPVGVCRMCGHQIIRYVHIMKHDQFYRTIGAGCICAEKMEGEAPTAKKREQEFKRRLARRETFLKHKLRRSRQGNEFMKYKGNLITLLPDKFKKDHYKTVVNGEFSKPYPTKQEALLDAFDRLDPWEY